MTTARLITISLYTIIFLCVGAANADGNATACNNPEATTTTTVDVGNPDDSILSLQYSAEESKNDEEQKAKKAKDFASYFAAYGELYHQKNMLTDTHRMESYYTAITANAQAAFKDKIVMDVGTGSGILAIWAAKAGAKKVYAIESTDMAINAIKLIKANGVEHIVTVIQGTVEDIELPLKEDGFMVDDDERVVDVIVSEWMGYMLLRESMLDSVLVARDRFLKMDTGLMFPSHATVMVAPIMEEHWSLDNNRQYDEDVAHWNRFVRDTKKRYGGVDYSVLTEAFNKETSDYYIYSSQWKELEEALLLAEPQVIKTLDLMACTLKDTRGIFDSSSNTEAGMKNGNVDSNAFDFVIDAKTTAISGIAGWFTTDFKSRTDDMASEDAPKLKTSVTLNTGPDQGYTHWGQQVFYFQDSVRMSDLNLKTSTGALPEGGVCGETTTVHLKGKLEMVRKKHHARLYNCRIEHSLEEIDNESKVVTRKTSAIESVYSVP